MKMSVNRSQQDSFQNSGVDEGGEENSGRRSSSQSIIMTPAGRNSKQHDYVDNESLSHEMLFAGIGNIAAACDATNAVAKRVSRSEEEKMHIRRSANRRSAKMSRDRKKVESDHLQEKANLLVQSNLALTKENHELRQQIEMLVMRVASIEKSVGGLGPSMVVGGNMGHQDLLSMHVIQDQQSQVNNHQQSNFSLRSLSLPSSHAFHGSLMSPNTALMQGSQMANTSLQLAAATQQYQQNNQVRMINQIDIMGPSLDVDPFEADGNMNKRRRT